MSEECNFLPPLFAEHLSEAPPEFICHYTNKQGLIGIVSSASLWATDINFMNNATEFQLAITIALKWLKKQEFNLDNYIDYHIPAHSNLVTNRQRTAISVLKVLKGLVGETSAHVICFCRDDDLLSQWRGYSGDSFGYCVGLRSAGLQLCGKQKGFILGKCIYETRAQVKIIREVCDHFLSDDVINTVPPDEVINRFAYTIQMCGAFFKHSKFVEENEWRLVTLALPREGLLFRPGKSMIIPYGQLSIGERERSCLHFVRVGPCPHMQLSTASVGRLLLRYGMSPRVEPTSIPFRDW